MKWISILMAILVVCTILYTLDGSDNNIVTVDIMECTHPDVIRTPRPLEILNSTYEITTPHCIMNHTGGEGGGTQISLRISSDFVVGCPISACMCLKDVR